MLPFILITLEINECLIATVHAGISMVSFIMVSLFVKRSIEETFKSGKILSGGDVSKHLKKELRIAI